MKQTRKGARPQVQRVLADHRKVGKRFIPPWFNDGTPLIEVSWVQALLPELLWIGLLHARWGIPEGSRLALALAKSAAKATEGKARRIFASTTSFSVLDSEQRVSVIAAIASERDKFTEALRPVLACYPKSPLAFLSGVTSYRKRSIDLDILKSVIEPLFDKTSTEAVFVQGAVVYIAFIADRLKVTTESSLQHLPALEAYPSTDLSQQVAAVVRATVPMLIQVPGDPLPSEWANYFWNRGIALDACSVRDE